MAVAAAAAQTAAVSPSLASPRSATVQAAPLAHDSLIVGLQLLHARQESCARSFCMGLILGFRTIPLPPPAAKPGEDFRVGALNESPAPVAAPEMTPPEVSISAATDARARRIEAVVLTPDELKKSSAGRKPFDAMLMFRMLVLQALNNLSDEQVESSAVFQPKQRTEKREAVTTANQSKTGPNPNLCPIRRQNRPLFEVPFSFRHPGRGRLQNWGDNSEPFAASITEGRSEGHPIKGDRVSLRARGTTSSEGWAVGSAVASSDDGTARPSIVAVRA